MHPWILKSLFWLTISGAALSIIAAPYSQAEVLHDLPKDLAYLVPSDPKLTSLHKPLELLSGFLREKGFEAFDSENDSRLQFMGIHQAYTDPGFKKTILVRFDLVPSQEGVLGNVYAGSGGYLLHGRTQNGRHFALFAVGFEETDAEKLLNEILQEASWLQADGRGTEGFSLIRTANAIEGPLPFEEKDDSNSARYEARRPYSGEVQVPPRKPDPASHVRGMVRPEAGAKAVTPPKANDPNPVFEGIKACGIQSLQGAAERIKARTVGAATGTLNALGEVIKNPWGFWDNKVKEFQEMVTTLRELPGRLSRLAGQIQSFVPELKVDLICGFFGGFIGDQVTNLLARPAELAAISAAGTPALGMAYTVAKLTHGLFDHLSNFAKKVARIEPLLKKVSAKLGNARDRAKAVARARARRIAANLSKFTDSQVAALKRAEALGKKNPKLADLWERIASCPL